MKAALEGQEACVQALLQAKANTELRQTDGHTALQCAEIKGHTVITDSGEPAVNSLAPLPLEIYESAERGELQKVVKWLHKGGLADAFCSGTTHDAQPLAISLLHAAASGGQLEIAIAV